MGVFILHMISDLHNDSILEIMNCILICWDLIKQALSENRIRMFYSNLLHHFLYFVPCRLWEVTFNIYGKRSQNVRKKIFAIICRAEMKKHDNMVFPWFRILRKQTTGYIFRSDEISEHCVESNNIYLEIISIFEQLHDPSLKTYWTLLKDYDKILGFQNVLNKSWTLLEHGTIVLGPSMSTKHDGQMFYFLFAVEQKRHTFLEFPDFFYICYLKEL